MISLVKKKQNNFNVLQGLHPAILIVNPLTLKVYTVKCIIISMFSDLLVVLFYNFVSLLLCDVVSLFVI